ncbi:TraB/GumN family protein [Parasediminibacterium paludis]|uniref:TraB/GumN family protein n=1 Tax=Parasediminibacterium paludis TaxID=908966 RepID=A0ABV8PXD1_9BACT
MKLFRILLIFVSIISYRVCHSQQTLPKSLLWRISGKNLQQPSYLFGTIHLQDKKVFNFPDSLYTAIEKCSVFALEVNPDSINNNMADYLSTKYEKFTPNKKKSKKLKELLTKEELDLLQKKLKKTDNVQVGDITLKQAYLLKDKLLASNENTDNMSTFMDAFLYKIALDKSKNIAGLEPLSNQMDLLDDLDYTEKDAKLLLANLQKQDQALNKLSEIYLDKNIEGIQNWVNLLPKDYEDKLLSKRNRVMLKSMDSIMQQQSLFAAVGAAHLPSSNGLINLLKQSGYTVEPVICNTYTHANNYVFTKKANDWVNVVDTAAGFIVKMPAKPSDADMGGGLIKMRTYIDITNNQGFYTMHFGTPAVNNKRQKDSIINIMAKKMIESADGIDVTSKDIVNSGVSGREFFFVGKNKIYFKLQLLTNDNDLFLLMTNCTEKSNKAIDSFHNSFKLIPKQKVSWDEKVFPSDFLTLKMPGNKPKAVTSYNEDSTTQQDLYSVVDESTSTYYFVSISKTINGRYFKSDSIHLQSIHQRLGSDSTNEFKSTKINSPYNGDEYEVKQANNTLVKGRFVYLGNRVINVFAVYSDKTKSLEQVNAFLQSIRLLPIPLSIYSSYTAPDSSFKTYATAPFKLMPKAKETYNYDNTEDSTAAIHYLSMDANKLTCFDIFKKQLNKYYWRSNDTAMLKKWIDNNKTYNDSISDIAYSINSNCISAEAIIYNRNNSYPIRVKVISQGRTRYTIKATISSFIKNDAGIDSVFNQFTILNVDTAHLQTSPLAFFTALHSVDSATHEEAFKATKEAYFDKNDLPLLLKEVNAIFKWDSANYFRVHSFIIDELEGLATDLTPSVIKNTYLTMPLQHASEQFKLLKLLTQVNDTTEGFATLKQLMLNHLPTSSQPYLLEYNLRQHPALTKTFFPDWLPLIKDSTCSNIVCQTLIDLIDSNYLSKDFLVTNAAAIIEHIKTLRNIIGKNAYYSGQLDLLKRINTIEAWKEINAYQYVKNLGAQYKAVSLLLETKKQLAINILDTIANDNDYRLSLYNLLKENKQTALFPKRFATQRYFAESLLISNDEDNDYESIKFLGERIINFKGKSRKFFLFEVKYNIDDKESYLGVSGAYSLNPLSLEVIDEHNITGIYTTEKLDKKLIDTQLKAYIKELEEGKEEIE